MGLQVAAEHDLAGREAAVEGPEGELQPKYDHKPGPRITYPKLDGFNLICDKHK